MQLLQLRLGRVFADGVRALCGTRLCRHWQRRADRGKDGRRDRTRGGFDLSRRRNAHRARSWSVGTNLCCSEESVRRAARCGGHGGVRAGHARAPGDGGPARLRREPRQPGSAVVCRCRSRGRGTAAQTRDRDRRDCPAASGRHCEHQYRPHRWIAAPDGRELASVAGRNHCDWLPARGGLHTGRGGDEGSRRGGELIPGGTRYHAHFVPDEEAVVDFYLAACEKLDRAGVRQYEISNFARAGFESRHNLKYWTRRPYLGFGVDAHSMLLSASPGSDAVRFATSDVLEQFVAAAPLHRTAVSRSSTLEESFFLGLRLTRGVNLSELSADFGNKAVENFSDPIMELVRDGLIQQDGDTIRLTAQGRLLSNEVFEKFLSPEEVLTATPPLAVE